MNNFDLLKELARRAMLEKGLAPEFSLAAEKQLELIDEPAPYQSENMRDLRKLLWCSIDNDDSRDLDQLTYAEKLENNGYRVYIGIADVDGLVSKNTPIDMHALQNTTSVYTAALIFPLLPEKLSTDFTSLNENVERNSVVFEITLNPSMELESSQIYRATIHNKAKLAYSSLGKWLQNQGPIPEKLNFVPGLPEAIKLQDEIAQSMKKKRHAFGALTFETRELKPSFDNGKVVALEAFVRNRAHELIENLMIAANTTSARYAVEKKIPSLRRIVRVPARWERIVELAAASEYKLSLEPDPKALDAFLEIMQKKSPETFPDLSLAIIKLLGSGEYVAELPGEPPIGHFGLALRDYTHSTAPNRRFPDLITQRLIKASLKNEKMPYSYSELTSLAAQCTEKEDAAAKVERQVKKSAAAMLLEHRIGEQFEALITGASDKGTWVRLKDPLVEGKLLGNSKGLDVGDRILVKLVSVNIERGFIDFVRSKS